MNISSGQKSGRGRPRKNEILIAEDNSKFEIPVSNIFSNKKRKIDENSGANKKVPIFPNTC